MFITLLSVSNLDIFSECTSSQQLPRPLDYAPLPGQSRLLVKHSGRLLRSLRQLRFGSVGFHLPSMAKSICIFASLCLTVNAARRSSSCAAEVPCLCPSFFLPSGALLTTKCEISLNLSSLTKVEWKQQQNCRCCNLFL